jgi:hypothetical protein
MPARIAHWNVWRDFEHVACRNSQAARRRIGGDQKITSSLRNMFGVSCFALGIVVMARMFLTMSCAIDVVH